MPELPEVEAARVLVRRVAQGRRIARVWCADDPIVFEGGGQRRVQRALRGREVRGVGRHGKHLWLELDRRPWPCFHFGMAGGFSAPLARGVRLVSSGHRAPGPAWPPRFTKLRLTFDDGGELVMSDGRRLGRIRLRQDPRAEAPISDLGFDALLGLPTPARFAELLGERTAPMKAILLDQSFAAGVGNWIADEVLYQARISPKRPGRSLSRAEANRVRTRLARIVALAVEAGADSDRYPKSWLFHYRWGRNAEAVTPRGEKIRHDTIGGRTTAWVPARQR